MPSIVNPTCPPKPVNAEKPTGLFRILSERERERLDQQYEAAWHGRRPMTLHYDLEIHSSNANAQNNIKNEWLEQGIWGDNWGPA
ncbi:unnamed protein product [Clonostachys rosea]|uniref:Uncharacterized protein n=1 Tax=Bionectria ochroleuca TaxID=29856 RepID=A0ABY6U343_BIOOC|nr:unnamed protein product [Clonostachys rosea]